MVDPATPIHDLQWLGLIGALCYICNYTMLVLRLTSTERVSYFVVNLTAASLVLASLGHAFNAGSAVIQTFFIGVSICGIVSRVRRRRLAARNAAPERPG